jgi:hypothetical protein
MPRKRANDANTNEDTDSPSTTPKIAKTKSDSLIARQPWSSTEERKFLESMDKIMKAHLWNEIKQDAELRKRGANGSRSHWDAMVRGSLEEDVTMLTRVVQEAQEVGEEAREGKWVLKVHANKVCGVYCLRDCLWELERGVVCTICTSSSLLLIHLYITLHLIDRNNGCEQISSDLVPEESIEELGIRITCDLPP